MQDHYLSAPMSHIPKCLQKHFNRAAARLSDLLRASPNDPALLKMFLILPRIANASWMGKSSACRTSAKALLQKFPEQLTTLDIGAILKGLNTALPRRDNTGDADARVRAVNRLLCEGFLSKAVKLLFSNGLCELDDDTIQRLRTLHPSPSDTSHPFPDGLTPNPDLSEHSLRSFVQAVRNLPNDSAPGPSGWSFVTIKNLVESEGGKEGPFTSWLYGLCRSMLQNRVDSDTTHGSETAGDWLRASRLLAIRKKDDTPRPIAVGEAFTRLAASWSLQVWTEDVSQSLEKQQFGVGTKGGVEPIVLELFSSFQDRAGEEEFLASIDFENAFNTISRHRIAEEVNARLPNFVRFAKFLYNTRSILLLRTPGGLVTLYSATGVRQGDPLAPLFFSLAISGLLLQLPEMANQLNLSGTLGAVKRWLAYLDDVYLRASSRAIIEAILNILECPTTVDRYGCTINRSKCAIISRTELHDKGFPVLGSYLSYTTDGTCEGTNALMDSAISLLRSRLPVLQCLSYQAQLIIIRKCFSPQLLHLTRTQHPDAIRSQCAEFDRILYAEICRLAGVIVEFTPTVYLPQRTGSLGVFSQLGISPSAYASSFVLCQGVLREKEMPISTSTLLTYEPYFNLCAYAIALPEGASVLSDPHYRTPQLQRRTAEVYHARADECFMGLLRRSPDPLRLISRRVEASYVLARTWINSLPTGNCFILSDEMVRFGLRRMLLTDVFDPLVADVTDPRCRSCGDYWFDEHYLWCPNNGRSRTLGHTAINRAICSAIKHPTSADATVPGFVSCSRGPNYEVHLERVECGNMQHNMLIFPKPSNRLD